MSRRKIRRKKENGEKINKKIEKARMKRRRGRYEKDLR